MAMQPRASSSDNDDAVVAWPSSLGLPSHVSSTSKHKRVALLFLSGIRASQLVAAAPSLPPDTRDVDSPAVIKLDPAVTPSGARMKGDAMAKYVRAAMPQFDASLPHRIFVSRERSYPSLVFSVLPNKRRSERPVDTVNNDLTPEYGKSHAHIFNPNLAPRRAGRRKDLTDWDHLYTPEDVDDPRIRLGRHRVVQNVPGMRLSVLPYAKLRVLKDELNKTFREQHLDLPANLTLSMIRTMKRKLLAIASQVDLEISSVALSYVFFEKLVLKGVVNKSNRRLVAAVCLLLAVKLNDAASKTKPVMAELESQLGVLPADVVGAEFLVFAQLQFHLVVPTRQYLDHFMRILKENDGVRDQHFLGENLDQTLEDMAALAREDSRSEGEDESETSSGRQSPERREEDEE